MTDLLVIIGLTVGCCVAVGAVGLLTLRALRRRSLRLQLVVAAVTPVIAVGASVAINVRLMFLSAHDSGVIVIALVTALVLSFGAVALVLRTVAQGSAVLGESLGLIVADGTRPYAARDIETASTTPVIIPELDRLRRELNDARLTLAESRTRERNAERARRELVRFMSHDLRTPLAGMRALIEGLQDDVITDVPRAHRQLRSTVGRMSGLVEDLFELSRVEASPAPPPSAVSLTELVGDVTDELTPAAAAAQVVVEVDLPTGDRLPVTGDADALARALANVVSNAIKHTGPGGQVAVRASRTAAGRLQISVTDGCGGIPDDHLQRVFDTGWRGTAARGTEAADRDAASSGGGGLGLAIAKKVVGAHDGSIAVANVAGGCRFDLELPSR